MLTLQFWFSALNRPSGLSLTKTTSFKQRILQLFSVFLYEWDMRSAEVFNALQLWSIAVAGLTTLTLAASTFAVSLGGMIVLLGIPAVLGLYQLYACLSDKINHRFSAAIFSFVLLLSIAFSTLFFAPSFAFLFAADSCMMLLSAWQTGVRHQYSALFEKAIQAKTECDERCKRYQDSAYAYSSSHHNTSSV